MIMCDQAVAWSGEHDTSRGASWIFSVVEGKAKIFASLRLSIRNAKCLLDTKRTECDQYEGEFYGIGVAKRVTEVFNARNKVTTRTKISTAHEVVGEDVPRGTSGGQQ